MQPPMIETLRKRLTDREHPARLHLIGVAGSGMSGLALMLMEMGHRVSGCDKLNYAVYGDLSPHLHVHIVPKYKGGVSWGQPFSDSLPKVLLTDAEYDAMIADLRAKLL